MASRNGFGSTARGEAHATSDLDLLITLDPGRGFFDLVAITIS